MTSQPSVAVLFARRDSVYKTIPACDVYDEDRDARKYRGDLPVIAHPPCRGWGALRHFAKPAPGELELATFAVDEVRRCGGVLEHPNASKLWPVAGLPDPGQVDRFGGFTLVIDQDWWGHRAEKRTRLYIVGVRPAEIPLMPLRIEEPPRVVTNGGSHARKGQPGYRTEITKPEREHTPPDSPNGFASWPCAA